MKEKIFLVIIGVLVGAVLATGVFFTYTLISNSGKCRDHQNQLNGGQPPSLPNGNNNGNSNSNQPPSMPGDNNKSNGQPPEKPGDNKEQNSTQDSNT